MALATYTELKDAVQRWSWRDGADNSVGDATFTSAIPEMVALAEARINRDLRTSEMEAVAVLTPTAGAAALPSDYLGFRSVTSGDRELSLVGASYAAFQFGASGKACSFSIVGANICLHPPGDDAVTLVYQARIPALGDSKTTNWLLTKEPDVYLRACLIEAADWMADTEEVGRQAQLYQRAVDKLQSTDTMGRYAHASRHNRGWMP